MKKKIRILLVGLIFLLAVLSVLALSNKEKTIEVAKIVYERINGIKLYSETDGTLISPTINGTLDIGDAKVVDTPYVSFVIPNTATHYWRNNDSDLYEVIIHNFTIKNDSNYIIRFTWTGDRYVSDEIDIHYLFEDKTLTADNINPYSLATYDRTCLNEFADADLSTIDASSCLITKPKADRVIFNNLTKEIGTIINYTIETAFNDTCAKNLSKIGTECEYKISKPIYSWKPYTNIVVKTDTLPNDFLSIDATNVGACGTLSTGGLYIQTAPLTSTTNCIYITGSNITFDGNGYNIDGDDGYCDSAVWTNLNPANVTMQNITTTDYCRAIRTYYQYNPVVIRNLNAKSGGGGGAGVELYATWNAYIENFSVDGQVTGYGVSLSTSNSSYNVIMNGNVNSSAYCFGGGYNDLYNNITRINCSSNSIADVNWWHPNADYNYVWDNLLNSSGTGIVNIKVTGTVGASNSYNITGDTRWGTNVLGQEGLIGGNYIGSLEHTPNSLECLDNNYNGLCDTNLTIDNFNVDFFPISSNPYWIPAVTFVSPTLANNSEINVNNYQMNWTIDTPRLNWLIYSFNETNFTSLASFWGGSIWNMDNRSELQENDSFVSDAGSYFLNSTQVTGVEWNSSGKYGGGYEFKKTGDIIRVRDSGNSLAGTETYGFTISAWVRRYANTNDLSGLYIGTVMGKNNATSGYHMIESALLGNYYFQIFLKNGTSLSTQIGMGNFTDKQWYQITGVYNTTDMLFYLDGQLKDTTFVNHTGSVFYPNKDNNFTIGSGDENVDRFFNGTIDDVRFSNYWYDAQEVKDNYETQLTKMNSTRYILYSNEQGLAEGTYNYSVTAYDYYNIFGNVTGTSNTSGTRVITYTALAGGDITFSNRMQTPSSPVVYTPTNKYEFNITATGNNGTLILNFGGINYTASNMSSMYNVTLTNLDNATYEYYFLGNKTDGLSIQEDTHYNYIVEPNPSACNILFNTTLPQAVYGEKFKVYTDCDSPTSTFQILREGIPVSNNSEQSLGADTWTFTLQRFNTNYTNYYDTEDFVVFQATTTCSLSYESPVNYPNSITINGTCSPDNNFKIWRYQNSIWNDVTSINGTKIYLGAGTWTHRINVTENQNYTTGTQSYDITIGKNNSACDMLFNETSPQAFGFKFKAYSNCDSNFGITRNAVFVNNNSEQFLSVGVYNFIVNRNDTQNYSSITDSELFEITGDTTPPYFIEIPTNQTLAYDTELNYDINATDDVALDSYAINWSNTYFIINSTGALKNATLLPVGIYMINITINDTTNNINSTIINVTIQTPIDTTPPYFIEIPTNQSYTYKSNIEIKFNATDNIGIQNYVVNDSKFSVTSTGIFRNNTIMGVGTYNLNLSAIDTNNNYNSTYFNVTINRATSEIELRLNGTRANKNIYVNSTISINATLLIGDLAKSINLYNGTSLLVNGITPIGTIISFNDTGSFNMTAIYTESQNFTRDSETWYVNVLAIPVGGGNVTSALCRYKYFGYYNERIPFMKEGGCI